MSLPSLEADCSQCAALCCILLPFDKSDAFAFDKAGGEPCRHLNADFRCEIHDKLKARGCSGCVRFDCHGAGQRVVQDLFAGQNLREAPELMDRMGEAFRRMRRVHELLVLLREAGRLPLGEAKEAERQAILKLLNPPEDWSEASLAAFDIAGAEKDVTQFLSSLRDVVEPGNVTPEANGDIYG